jgi:hypothetical protein
LTQQTTTSARAIATSLVIAAIALALIAKGVQLLRFETAEAAAMAILARETSADQAGREARRREIQRAHRRGPRRKAQSLRLVVIGGLRQAPENAPEFWPGSRDLKVSLITHLKRLILALIFEYLF